MEVKNKKETAIQRSGRKVFQAEVTASVKAQRWEPPYRGGRRRDQRGRQGADCAGLVGFHSIHRNVSSDLHFIKVISARLRTDLRGQG